MVPPERGAAGILVLVVTTALVGGALLGTAELWRDLDDAARARTAADAAALAGLDGGRDAAARLASANGADLVAWRSTGDVVEVVVRRGGVTVVARATNAP